MTLRRVLTCVVTVVMIASLMLVAGCKDDESPGVVSYWPEAEAERTVEEPPEPIRWPLTGLEAPSEEAITQRVVSVKVENSPDARPQSSLQYADIVYESVTEGGITRFNALFHSQEPEVVGPVRSARLSDTYIVPQYQALFVFSGASSSVNAAVRASGVDNLSEDAGVTYPFFRSTSRAMPHNLYITFERVREEAENRGMTTAQEITGLAFDQRSIDETVTVSEIDIPFSNANRVIWTYDTDTKMYYRVNNGAKFMDQETGEQIGARNVVVMWARHDVASHDVVGSTTYDIVLSGSGKVSVFHDGQRYDGTWEAGTDTPPVFKAADGTQIKLAPGNTWMQVVNTSVNISMK